jgi:hypothetical protein
MSAFTSSLPALAGSSPVAVGTLAASGAEGTMAGLAARLGMSAENLQGALKQGQSIAGLAQQQGVSRESIGSFIGAQIQRARLYSGQPALDDEALSRTVDRALDRGRRQDPSTPAPAAVPASYEAVATAAYASNARPLPAPAAPAGGSVSLLV